MHPRKQLIEDGIINEDKQISRLFIARFYDEQLVKFDKIGVGGQTENGIEVTPELIDITIKRRDQLRPPIKKKTQQPPKGESNEC